MMEQTAKKQAPILSPAFKWVASYDHMTPDGFQDFRERQRQRIRDAQPKAKKGKA